MNVHEVLSRCRDLGVILAPGSEGKLRVSPPGKLPEELREQLRQRKAEVLALLAEPVSPPWPEEVPFCRCGHPAPLIEETAQGSRHYLCEQCGYLALVPKEPGKPYVPPQDKPFTPGKRDFLPRPLGQENTPDPWEAWTPLMIWLLEHHPDRFHAVCEAEEAIRALERAGSTAGPGYEQACAELLRRFEEARRLKLSESVKVWVQ